MLDITKFVKNNRISVIVKPNANKTEVTGFNEETNILSISLKAVPDKGKANQELIRFVSKLLKNKVRIVSGLKSRKKTLECI